MLKLTNINKTFKNQILKDFSLKIKNGEKVAITGPSGIGKTTLTNIILGFVEIDSGQITNEFENTKVVFQENRLIEELSSLDNLKLVSEKDDNTLKNFLIEFGIEDANKPVANLSGGMKRRVSILRALLEEGDFLILDEPIQGLDPENRDLVIGKILENYKDKGILLITHNIKDIKDFKIDRVINIR